MTTPSVATKADIDQLREELRTYYAAKADLEAFKVDLLRRVNRQTWMLLTSQLVMLGVLVGLLRL